TPAVRLWETATGKEIVTLPTGPANYLALCDSRTLVAVGPDSFRVLDVSSGRELLRSVLPEGTGALYSKSYGQGLCLSADARRAVTSLADGTLLVWDLTLARREAAGKNRRPTPKMLAAWWTDLAHQDAAQAYRALWSLADAPDEAVTFLKDHLK